MKNPGFLSIIFFSLTLLCIPGAMGQDNGRIDSLQRLLHLTHENRAKARLLLIISKDEEIRNPGKSLKFAKQALQVAQKIEYDSAEVRAMISIGVNYTRMMLLKEAIEIGEQIVEKASIYDMQLEIADGRGIMAVAYAQGGDFDNSSKLYFENIKLYETLYEKRLLGGTLGNIGVDFIEQQNYEKALEYINKALNIGLEINDSIIITDQYSNLAAIYQVGYNDLSKAMTYYFEALRVAKKIEDFQQQGYILLNIGRVYLERNNFESAFICFEQSLSIFQKLNNPVLLADSYIELGNYYFHIGEYDQGRKFAMSGLEIGEKNEKLQTIFNSADLLNKICLSENDTLGAYRYLVIRTNALNSLIALQNQKELFRLEFQYNQDKKTEEQKTRQQRNYFILGFIILGLSSGLSLVMLFNSRQKIKIKNALLEKENAESNLKFKNKELSINILALIKKNELIAEIRQKFTELEKALPENDAKEVVARFNHEIKLSSDDRLWQEFSMRFKEINSEFYDKLLNKFPDLTQSELKLCAYLRLNMSTKEIADLTGQSSETLGKARYRLRKKFGLTNSESNLVMFLSQI